ncbi:pentapeptide repeat-containing protein [Nonomuraea sp. B12E4]|uniref:pentapeptide repeat-containing protein n=1 Tax=Nonomuraea sp. B12E4 TaxID=3153564 RepID=UPI00325D250D
MLGPRPVLTGTLAVRTLPVRTLPILTGTWAGLTLSVLAGTLPVLAGGLSLLPLTVRTGTLRERRAVALLRGALLRGALLRGALLRGALLRGALLRGALSRWWAVAGDLTRWRPVRALAGGRAVTGLRSALAGWRAVSLRRPLIRCAPRILRLRLRLRRLRRMCHITIVV